MSHVRYLDVAAALDSHQGDVGVRTHPSRVRQALSLLDGFQLRSRGRVVSTPLSTQRLLAFLALHERPVQRVFVAGSLWLAASEDRANASLRTALWRLHRLDGRLVDVTPTQVALVSDVLVDVRFASAAAHRAIRDEAEDGDLAELCNTRELLPDWYDDWVVIERERFRQLRLHALDALCDRLTAAARYADAADAALCAIAVEPLRESSHRALIRTHLAEGNPGEAIRQYRLYRDLLASDLGLDPSPELRALVRAVGDPVPERLAEGPSLRQPAPAPHA